MPDSIKRKKIADHFGDASNSYDVSARLQRYSGKNLMPWMPQCPDQTLVDLGCGTGFFSEILSDKFKSVIGVDLSMPMLKLAKSKNKQNNSWLNADAMHLPFTDNSIDCVFSNLVLQWCDPLQNAIEEVVRILKPGGRFVFCTLLEGTLTELKQAWAEVDDDQHVNDFHQIQQLNDIFQQCDVSIVEQKQQDIVLEYASVIHLAHELKGLGANFVPLKKQKGLAGKGKWQQMSNVYKQFTLHDGIVPATYCLYLVCLEKTND